MTSVQRLDPAAAPARVTSEILDRQPPRSLEAERAVLGSMMLVPDVCDEVALAIRADDFYDEAHRRIYRHLQAMHEEGRSTDDLTLLHERLKSAGDAEFVGGVPYLAELTTSTGTAAHAVYYAEIVRDKSTLRSLIHSSTEILRNAYDESIDSRDMLAQAEQKIFAILDGRGASNVGSIQDILHEALSRIDARMNRDGILGGVETGFTELDAMTGGLHESELIILAGRPSMGKTALALNIAEFVAMKSNTATLFVSLEMSSMELADRMLRSIAKVNGQRLRNGTVSNEDRRNLVEKAAELSQAPLFVDDSPSRTMTEIAAAARRLKRKNNLGFIVIDYLQLIDPDNARDPRQEQVAKIARRLKGMAREIKVPVMCLAQLNRQAEAGKEDHRPRLSHLRESGAIEQDADVVMFVHRDEYYLTGASNEEARSQAAGKAEIIIAKQRNGPTGEAKVLWNKDFTRFLNFEHRPYDEFERHNNSEF